MKKVKRTSQSTVGTSHFGHVIYTNLQVLESILGEPTYYEADKSFYTWNMELDGKIFTVYDYKEEEFSETQTIGFHIGANGRENAHLACQYISDRLDEINFKENLVNSELFEKIYILDVDKISEAMEKDSSLEKKFEEFMDGYFLMVGESNWNYYFGGIMPEFEPFIIGELGNYLFRVFKTRESLKRRYSRLWSTAMEGIDFSIEENTRFYGLIEPKL